MKIVILLFASLFGFGLASQEALLDQPQKETTARVEQAAVLEAPVMDVVLDTVEITVSAQSTVAGI